MTVPRAAAWTTFAACSAIIVAGCPAKGRAPDAGSPATAKDSNALDAAAPTVTRKEAILARHAERRARARADLLTRMEEPVGEPFRVCDCQAGWWVYSEDASGAARHRRRMLTIENGKLKEIDTETSFGDRIR